METLVYKSTGALELRADVFWDPDSEGPRPAIVWMHGGALISGARPGMNPLFLSRVLAAGWALVGIDYRLAPETKLAGILEDVQDAHGWVREQGPAIFGADPDRVATGGGSAGGYLALLAGCHVSPRPRAIVSFYGYGDLLGDWYTKPSPYYCSAVPMIEESAARAVVGATPLGEPDPARPDRALFYTYCRQQGIWTREVTGIDPETNRAAVERFCPALTAAGDFPPTVLLHGEGDTDVPCEQSVQMAARLRDAGVEHELVTYPKAWHCFDFAWGDTDQRPEIADSLDRTMAFLKRRFD